MTRRALLLATVGLFALAGTSFPALASRSVAAARSRLSGPRAAIDVTLDVHGIPHVRAQSLHDAYWAQGYLVARDRLFQLDFELRQETGRMAEAFGAEFVAADRAARLFHYRGDLHAELAAIPADVVDCVAGYCAGINAWIDEIAENPLLAPLEYALLGIVPLRWSLEDCVRRRGAGSDDADEQIRRAQLAARGLLEYEAWRDPLRPAWEFRVPEGLDCAAVSPDDLGVLRDINRLPRFTPEMISPIEREARRVDQVAQGSNAWTVAGSRTATGRPLLANDPHLAIGGFSPRHIIHLTAPGLDIIGAGNPGLPGIMQGHTERFAFGRTNFRIDQSDLFVLRTHPADPDRYWHEGQWKTFETYEEELPVKGQANERVVFRYAQGRPIISQDPDSNRAIAFATVTMLPGANMRFAIVALNLVRDWDSLREAARLHVSPTNLHYADVDGNTGWHAIGYAPRRAVHDGLFPVPGDGKFDWAGTLSLEEMPSIFNPEQGWLASANDMNLPPDYPHAERILSFNWSDPFRHDRIKAVLAAQSVHSQGNSIALLHDVRSLPAIALKRMLPQAPTAGAARAAQMLEAWNGDLAADSAAALLFEMVLPELLSAFHAQVIPTEARDLITRVNLEAMLTALETLSPRIGADPAAVRTALINQALERGWERAVALAGSDPAIWKWGDLHRVDLAHPLASALPSIASAFPTIEGGQSGGDGTTVMARGLRDGGGFDVRHGASFMFVADVGDWDRTRFSLLPGQSADPRSPHYRDFYDKWLAGDMPELPFSQQAIGAVAVHAFTIPAAPPR